MGYEVFIPKKFNPRHAALIEKADSIMRNYARQGYDLSLRQLYYQFVAHHGLQNSEQSYKMLGGVISDARLAGKLDWNNLVDRGRETVENPHWGDPANFLEVVAKQYRFDLWEDQPMHVEVMVEKQALEGVLEPVCRRLDVPFTANKGYSSSSSMYACGQRLKDKLQDGKSVHVLYLGDHDPSGIDMTRDVEERLGLFSGFTYYNEGDRVLYESGDYDDQTFTVERIALNMDQIRRYDPPPNPAKMTDSRAEAYVRRHGNESWELDALDPETLAALVTDSIEIQLDQDLWEAAKSKMARERQDLMDMASEYRKKQEDDE